MVTRSGRFSATGYVASRSILSVEEGNVDLLWLGVRIRELCFDVIEQGSSDVELGAQSAGIVGNDYRLRYLAPGKGRGVFTDRAVVFKFHQRCLGEQFKIGVWRQVSPVDDRRSLTLDADGDAGTGKTRAGQPHKGRVGGVAYPDDTRRAAALLDALDKRTQHVGVAAAAGRLVQFGSETRTYRDDDVLGIAAGRCRARCFQTIGPAFVIGDTVFHGQHVGAPDIAAHADHGGPALVAQHVTGLRTPVVVGMVDGGQTLPSRTMADVCK